MHHIYIVITDPHLLDVNDKKMDEGESNSQRHFMYKCDQ